MECALHPLLLCMSATRVWGLSNPSAVLCRAVKQKRSAPSVFAAQKMLCAIHFRRAVAVAKQKCSVPPAWAHLATGEDFLSHLTGVEAVLRDWGEPEPVCLAGLFHSIYGTEGFQVPWCPPVFPFFRLSIRPSVRPSRCHCECPSAGVGFIFWSARLSMPGRLEAAPFVLGFLDRL
jgi:hypothetical protein